MDPTYASKLPPSFFATLKQRKDIFVGAHYSGNGAFCLYIAF